MSYAHDESILILHTYPVVADSHPCLCPPLPAPPHTPTAGILLLRPKALPLVRAWGAALAASPRQWDQRAFNALIRQGWRRIPGDPKHLFAGVNGTLRVGVLPVPLFANGHVYFVQRLPQALKVEPYAVHAVHQFSGTEGKRHRFREGMLWVDGPEYYTPKGEAGMVGEYWQAKGEGGREGVRG